MANGSARAISVSLPGTFNKTKPRSARGKISNSELKIFSRTSFRSSVLPSSWLMSRSARSFASGLTSGKFRSLCVIDLDRRVDCRLLVISLLDL